jgi:hypothetical protein
MPAAKESPLPRNYVLGTCLRTLYLVSFVVMDPYKAIDYKPDISSLKRSCNGICIVGIPPQGCNNLASCHAILYSVGILCMNCVSQCPHPHAHGQHQPGERDKPQTMAADGHGDIILGGGSNNRKLLLPFCAIYDAIPLENATVGISDNVKLATIVKPNSKLLAILVPVVAGVNWFPSMFRRAQDGLDLGYGHAFVNAVGMTKNAGAGIQDYSDAPHAPGQHQPGERDKPQTTATEGHAGILSGRLHKCLASIGHKCAKDPPATVLDFRRLVADD